MKELIADRELLGLGDRFQKEEDIMSSGSGSDSDPTQDGLDEIEMERLIPAACIQSIEGPSKKESE